MKVKDVMTRDVISVSPKTKVIEAAKKMKSANIHTVLVIQDRKLAEGKDPAKVHVDEIMTRGPITVEPETSVLDAGKLMKKHKISRLPVVDNNGVVVGIVSETDLPTIVSKLE